MLLKQFNTHTPTQCRAVVELVKVARIVDDFFDRKNNADEVAKSDAAREDLLQNLKDDLEHVTRDHSVAIASLEFMTHLNIFTDAQEDDVMYDEIQALLTKCLGVKSSNVRVTMRCVYRVLNNHLHV